MTSSKQSRSFSESRSVIVRVMKFMTISKISWNSEALQSNLLKLCQHQEATVRMPLWTRHSEVLTSSSLFSSSFFYSLILTSPLFLDNHRWRLFNFPANGLQASLIRNLQKRIAQLEDQVGDEEEEEVETVESSEMTSPRAGKTRTEPGSAASKQKVLSQEELQSLHPDVVDELGKLDIESVVKAAQEYLLACPGYSLLEKHLMNDNEMATRQFLDAEFWACFAALSESAEYGSKIDHKLRLFVEYTDTAGPASSSIMDYFVRIVNPDDMYEIGDWAVCIEAKDRKLQSNAYRCGKAFHQLRCELDCVRARVNTRHGIEVPHRRFGMLVTKDVMYVCYTTRTEGSVHQASVDKSQRLHYWIRLLLIAAGCYEARLFDLNSEEGLQEKVPYDQDDSDKSQNQSDGSTADDHEDDPSQAKDTDAGAADRTPDTKSAQDSDSLTPLDDVLPLTVASLALRDAALPEDDKLIRTRVGRSKRALHFLTYGTSYSSNLPSTSVVL
eukprot:m.381381 g.381381  ORF g.381381 m.381381 type:complete len:499 (+) comp16715_c2_seq18:276-1772(+)